MTMTVVPRLERWSIGILVGLGCVLLTTVAAWWTVAALSMYTRLALGETEIARAALGGLAVGGLLDALFLRHWVDRFYRLTWVVLVLVYLPASAIACAFLMGMPFGNLALGTLAGAYVGRRAAVSGLSRGRADRLRRATSGFATLITSVWAVPFAMLSLGEGLMQGLLTRLLGWPLVTITGAPGVALMLAVCCVLAAVQFFLTGLAFRLTFSK